LPRVIGAPRIDRAASCSSRHPVPRGAGAPVRLFHISIDAPAVLW
jgi:hypothetical protein